MADRKCDCDEWEDGIAQIVGVQAMSLTHSFIPKYTAAPFRFCPWCGKKLYGILEAENQEKTDSVKD